MKKYVVLLLMLLAASPCLYGQTTAKPKMLVKPYTKEGENKRKVLEGDVNMRIAISKVKESFRKRGYMMVNANADVVVDTEIELMPSPKGNAVRIMLTAYDKEGNSLANAVSESGKFYTDDYGKLASKAVERCSESFLNELQEQLSTRGESVAVAQNATPANKEPVYIGNSAVDKNIYVNKETDNTTFVAIIGNEKYKDVAEVPFAENDARIFSEYCKKTLGVSENHVRLYVNATYNDIRKAVNWLKQGLSAYNGEGRVIFYYAGHGIPNEADKTAYLLPVDGIGSDIESAYSLSKLYQTLGELPAQSVTVFLDACFSGAKRDGEMMASARGVAIKAKPEAPKGKMVIFTAAQGDETAYPFKSQQHGMFTYFLLKKLQESKGNVTLGELGDYLTKEVKRQSFDENNKMQTPTVNASAALQSTWRSMKLK